MEKGESESRILLKNYCKVGVKVDESLKFVIGNERFRIVMIF